MGRTAFDLRQLNLCTVDLSIGMIKMDFFKPEMHSAEDPNVLPFLYLSSSPFEMIMTHRGSLTN